MWRMVKWRPIATAPKTRSIDGQLGLCVAIPYGSRWTFRHAWWDDEQEEWTDITSDRFVKPLYWMPLPPKASEEQEPRNESEVTFLAVRRAIDKWPEATLVERVGLAIAETYQFPKGREGPSRSPLTDHTVIQLAKAALMALEEQEP